MPLVHPLVIHAGVAAMRIFAVRVLFGAFLLAVMASLAACGGGGGGSPAPSSPALQSGGSPPPSGGNTGNTANTSDGNVVAITLDGGTDGLAFNMPFVSVTVCVPGTSTCQTVDHVLLDTGSFGLRLAASALNPAIALPKLTAPSGNALAECASFVSGVAWGSVRAADVSIGGESVSALPIQVVNDSSVPAIPRGCSSLGSNFGVGGSSNGILGIGVFAQDCGGSCALSANNGTYYSCDASSCVGSAAPLASQVTNPTALFAADNNGAVVTLPTVPLTGTSSASGTLTFGIGTRANNQLGGATVYAASSSGGVQTTYNGTRYAAFFDTGSNALSFQDPNLPQCSGGFYCPATPQTLSAIVTSATGVSTTVSFTIEGLQSVSSTAVAAPVGANPSSLGRAFDWGLPFFFGRTVFVARSGAVTPAGPGPYWAF
jgi:hypothetical protein